MKVQVVIFVLFAVVGSSQGDEPVAKVTTNFSCEGRVTGYYADIESGCRNYHYCTGGSQYTYSCPNNTLFQQRIFICNHWYLVDCERSEEFYSANLLIGQRDKPFVGEEDALEITHPTPPTLEVPGTTDYTETHREPVTEEVNLSDFEDIQRVEQTPRATATTDSPTVTTTTTTATTIDTKTPSLVSVDKDLLRIGKANTLRSNDLTQADDSGFIKLRFSDPRRLFYIPDDADAPVTSSPIREFLIPKATTGHALMHFKDASGRDGGCPKYCHPKFFKPGTCHPCITIK